MAFYVDTRTGLSLCTGIGGLDLGLALALPGYRTVAAVEIEATAIAVLVARQKDKSLAEFPVWTDLKTFDGRPWAGLVDIVSGGYPCQPFSTAGKRRGADDPRHLWPHISRIVSETRPEWCFFENVAGHLSLGYHDVVKPDLESIGYRVEEGIFTAQEVGAPHRRERLFILAHKSGAGLEGAGGGWFHGAGREPEPPIDGTELAHAGHGSRSTQPEQPQVGEQGRPGLHPAGAGQHSEGVADTLIGTARETQASGPDGTGRVAPAGAVQGVVDTDKQRSQGRRIDGRQPDEWLAWPPSPANTTEWARVLAVRPDLAPAQREVRRVAHEFPGRLDISRTDRLKLLGNSVVPAQAALAFTTLRKRFQ